MTGTILNCLAILIGSIIGVRVGDRLPQSMRESIVTGLGLIVVVVALQNAFKTGNILIPLIGLLIGTIIGEALNIQGALERFGGWLRARVERNAAADSDSAGRTRFINAFVTASLVFCVGPLAILGSIKNGMNAGDIELLAIKSTLDFFASIAFAATLGIGVAFSIIPTLVLQGGFSIVGALLVGVLTAGASALSSTNPYIREITGVGGVMLLGIALILLNLKQPKVANFLPALVITPLIVLIASLLNINIYP